MLIIVVGLPGSGKTEFCKRLEGYIVYDDKLPVLQWIDFYSNLEQGYNVCLNDPRLCYYPNFERLIRHINVAYKVIVFKNQPQICIRNVQGRLDKQRYINDIIRYSKSYDTGLYGEAIIMECYSNETQSNHHSIR